MVMVVLSGITQGKKETLYGGRWGFDMKRIEVILHVPRESKAQGSP